MAAMALPASQSTPATSLGQLQLAMNEFVRSRGWYAADSPKPQAPTNLATSVVLEASELLECFQWGEEPDLNEVGAEMADVLLYVAQLANVLKIDLEAALAEKMRINEGRWQPAGGNGWPPRLAS
jgi:8-oxo-dGTP diphosphatase